MLDGLVSQLHTLALSGALGETVTFFGKSFAWLSDLFTKDSVAHAVLILGLVIALGVAIGRIKVFGISLGIAGVLFAGLAFGHFGMGINHHVLEFVREFGLILFVYTIGLQVGPGFLASLRKAGLRLNMMAASIVLLGAGIAVAMILGTQHLPERYRITVPIGVGILSGGVTNTPSLGAANAAIRDIEDIRAKAAAATPTPHAATAPATEPATEPALAAATEPATEPATLPATAPAALANAAKPDAHDAHPAATPQTSGSATTTRAYAIAYPFGIMGIIFTMLLIRGIFRVDPAREYALFTQLQGHGAGLETINLEVTNPNLDALQLQQIPILNQGGVVVSRVLKGDKAIVAQPDTTIRKGDVLHVVGPKAKFDDLKLVIGTPSKVDVKAIPSHINSRRMIVTNTAAFGKTVEELGLQEKYDVTITRTSRAEIEIPFNPNWRFQFADVVLVVGSEESLKAVEHELGNSVKKLEHPHMIPIFVGIALGVILGSWPVPLPGLPAPVKLGLAGGPLLVAIILSRIGQIGGMSWYMPRSANLTMREFGIVLFLACVGLYAGGGFVQTIVDGPGLYWMGMAALITAVPLLTVGLIGRIMMKLNYVQLCGVLSGSMTDPPALAFANTMVGNESPSIAYATVYPLTMLLRVVTAQAIVLTLFR